MALPLFNQTCKRGAHGLSCAPAPAPCIPFPALRSLCVQRILCAENEERCGEAPSTRHLRMHDRVVVPQAAQAEAAARAADLRDAEQRCAAAEAALRRERSQKGSAFQLQQVPSRVLPPQRLV